MGMSFLTETRGHTLPIELTTRDHKFSAQRSCSFHDTDRKRETEINPDSHVRTTLRSLGKNPGQNNRAIHSEVRERTASPNGRVQQKLCDMC